MTIFKKKNSLWALYYHHEGFEMDGDKLMGRQAAGNSLLKAYAKSKYTDIGIFAKNPDHFKQLKNDFYNITDDCLDKNLLYILSLIIFLKEIVLSSFFFEISLTSSGLRVNVVIFVSSLEFKPIMYVVFPLHVPNSNIFLLILLRDEIIQAS